MEQAYKLILILGISFGAISAFSQKEKDTINAEALKKIIVFLASDKLQGRGNFTPELTQAANFIADEFRQYGLEQFPGSATYFLPFVPERGFNVKLMADVNWNGRSLLRSKFDYILSAPNFTEEGLTDFRIIKLDSLIVDSLLYNVWNENRDILLWKPCNSDSCQAVLPENVLLPDGTSKSNIVLVVDKEEPQFVKITLDKVYRENVLMNVVGVIPGKSKPNELVIFSAHYDHVGKSNELAGDNIFNGANDNASGTATMLSLARYYSLRNDNERTLMFCAFAGEELGLLGSETFVRLLNPNNVITVINLEMLDAARAGDNTFFISGEKLSNLKTIFQKNLREDKVKVVRESEGRGGIFGRSDNYPFALKGIPAHTIMCSDDYDPCYHKPCDEAGRINFERMSRIVRAIAKACSTIISGIDTPSRINPDKAF